MDEATLGERLQLARKRAGLTQQELCQKAGLSYSTLAKIERGAIKSPSVFTVAAIAGATNTPLEELLDIDIASSTTESAETKKRSKTGVRFVYFDVVGTLIRFFEKAFAEIARESQKPLEIIETLYWRYDVAACRSEMTVDEVDAILAREFDINNFHWLDYYLKSAESTPHMKDLLEWVEEHYKLGLLTNNWLGFTDAMITKKLIPDLNYTAILESAKQKCAKPEPKIYQLAQELSGYGPSEILLVDDNPAYLREADKLGWQVMRFDGFDPEGSIERIKKHLEF